MVWAGIALFAIFNAVFAGQRFWHGLLDPLRDVNWNVIGIFIGTYSSIYVASTAALMLGSRTRRTRARAVWSTTRALPNRDAVVLNPLRPPSLSAPTLDRLNQLLEQRVAVLEKALKEKDPDLAREYGIE